MSGSRRVSASRRSRHGDWVGHGGHVIDWILSDVKHGRFERSLSGLMLVVGGMGLLATLLRRER